MSSRRVRQHVNPLSSGMLAIDVQAPELPDGPVDVELGSAEARLLIELAQADPDRTYVGIEIRRELIRRANRDVKRAGLSNVHNVFANLMVDLPRILPPGRVDRFFVYFPDPWFKKWQHKRRVIEPALADAMLTALTPTGEIHVATDIFDLALDAMSTLEMLADQGLLKNVAGPWTFAKASPVTARSWREQQCETDGKRVWRVSFRRLPA